MTCLCLDDNYQTFLSDTLYSSGMIKIRLPWHHDDTSTTDRSHEKRTLISESMKRNASAMSLIGFHCGVAQYDAPNKTESAYPHCKCRSMLGQCHNNWPSVEIWSARNHPRRSNTSIRDSNPVVDDLTTSHAASTRSPL